MTNEPDQPEDRPEGEDGARGDNQQNPFAGTPFEQLFGMFSGGLFGPGPGSGQSAPGGPLRGAFGRPADFSASGNPGIPDLSSLLGPMQALFSPHEGPINWTFVVDMARRAAASEPDPTPGERQRAAVADALRLADHWLDDATSFASGITTTAAWSRAEWIVNTIEVWKPLVEPVASQDINALGGALPQEARDQMGPLLGMMSKASGAMFAQQAAAALGALATEVLSASDIGLPLGPAGTAAILPTNLAAFTEGLDQVTAEDALLYLALREAAHQRLFAHVPWLRDHLVSAVADYAQGIEMDMSGMEEQLRSIDPMNPASIQEALSNGLFEPKKTPSQQAALERLEVTLALVEGWVDEVVSEATRERMPVAAKLREAFRRRRAAGGPAEQTFASLVGLELRPRRLRDASTLWGSLRDRQGLEARDGVWMDPLLLPTAADLDDPLGFREGAEAIPELSDDEFEAGLRDLLAPRVGGTSAETDTATNEPAEGPSDDGEGSADPNESGTGS